MNSTAVFVATDNMHDTIYWNSRAKFATSVCVLIFVFDAAFAVGIEFLKSLTEMRLCIKHFV